MIRRQGIYKQMIHLREKRPINASNDFLVLGNMVYGSLRTYSLGQTTESLVFITRLRLDRDQENNLKDELSLVCNDTSGTESKLP